jgi:hypothetical protein
MGQWREVEAMFHNVTYNQFTSPQLREAMIKKVAAVRAKIEERQGRIKKIQADNGITSEMATDLVLQYMQDQQRGVQKMSYSNSAQPVGAKTPQEVIIPAGVIANIVTEKSLIETENMEAKRLDLIIRNLKDEVFYNHPDTGLVCKRQAIHTLSDADIEYLGF